MLSINILKGFNVRLIFLLTLLISLSSTTYANDIDFAEASMEYYRDDLSKPHFQIDWDERNNVALVTLRLKWLNFSEQMHGHGFNLNFGYKPYLISPELYEKCKLSKIIGELDRPEKRTYYEVSLVLEGESCPKYFESFEYMSLRASSYNVPLLSKNGLAINFHLFIFDSP